MLGLYSLLAVFAYVILAVGVTYLFVPFISSLMVQKESLEGDFRLAHAGIRRDAESIAFAVGEDFERRFLDAKWLEIQRNQMKLIYFGGALEGTYEIHQIQ